MSNLLRRLGRSTAIALIVSPAGLLLIAVTRLLIISNYNSVTAVTLVSSSGYVNTLLGTVIPLVSIFMPYIALVLLFFRKFAPGILALVAAVMITPTRLSKVTLLNLMRSDLQPVGKLGGVLAVIFLFLAFLTAALLFFTLALFGFGMFFRTVGLSRALRLSQRSCSCIPCRTRTISIQTSCGRRGCRQKQLHLPLAGNSLDMFCPVSVTGWLSWAKTRGELPTIVQVGW
jgi:hypothetical protein